MKKIMLGMMLSVALPVLAQATEYKIEMKSDEDTGQVYFEPKELKIHSGDTVIFTQVDPYNIHNVMFEAVPNGADIPMMSQEEMNEEDTWKVTFSKPGTYKYHCHPHYDMGMKGEIIVDHASKPEEMKEEEGHHHEHGEHMHGDMMGDMHGMMMNHMHEDEDEHEGADEHHHDDDYMDNDMDMHDGDGMMMHNH